MSGGRKTVSWIGAAQWAGLIFAIVPSGSAWASSDSMDVLMRTIARPTPSAQSMITCSDMELKMLLGHETLFAPGGTLFLEIWVSDVGPVNSGITGFFTDLTFDSSILRADALFHSPGPFTLLTSGLINNPMGLIENFGGNDASFTGQGAEPNWSRISYAQMTAVGLGAALIDSSLGLGGIGTFGRQPPTKSDIDFDSITLTIPEPSLLCLWLIALAPSRRLRRFGVVDVERC